MNKDPLFLELQAEYVSQSLNLLDLFNDQILGLEKKDDRSDCLAKLSTVMQSIRRGAAVMDYSDMVQFAHRVEDLLAFFRVTLDTIDSANIVLLLQISRELTKGLTQFKNQGLYLVWNPVVMTNRILEEIDRLNREMNSSELTMKVEINRVSSIMHSVGEIAGLAHEGGSDQLSELIKKLQKDVNQLHHQATPDQMSKRRAV